MTYPPQLQRVQELLFNDKNFLGVQYRVQSVYHPSHAYERRLAAAALGRALESRFFDDADPLAFEQDPYDSFSSHLTYRLELYYMSRRERTELWRIIQNLERLANIREIDSGT